MIRLLRQTVFFQALAYCLQFGAFLVFARSLGSADQGALTVFRAVGQMIASLMWFGLPAGIVYFVGKDGALFVSLTKNCLKVFSCLFPLLVLALYVAPIDRIPKFNFLRDYTLHLILFVLCLSFYALFQQLILSVKRYFHYNLFAFGAGLLVFVFSVLAASLPTQRPKLTLAVVSYVAVYALMFVYGFALVSSEWLRQKSEATKTVCFSEQSLVGIRGFVSKIAGVLLFRIDLFFVGYFLSLKEVGVYSIALFSAEMITKIPYWLASVLGPMVASNEEGHIRKTAYLFYSSIVLALLFGSLFVLVVVIFPGIISAMIGEDFVGAEVCLLLLLPRVIMQSGTAVLGANLGGKGYPWYHPAGTMASVVCLVLLDVLLIPRGRIAGAALANSLAFTACFCFFYLGYRKYNGGTILLYLRPFISDVLKRISARRVTTGASQT